MPAQASCPPAEPGFPFMRQTRSPVPSGSLTSSNDRQWPLSPAVTKEGTWAPAMGAGHRPRLTGVWGLHLQDSSSPPNPHLQQTGCRGLGAAGYSGPHHPLAALSSYCSERGAHPTLTHMDKHTHLHTSAYTYTHTHMHTNAHTHVH